MGRAARRPPPAIRPARPEEADELGDLAFRSKALWGYPAEFMERCRPELSLSPDDVRAHPVFVAEHDGQLVGFYALKELTPESVDLWFLFIEPERVRSGAGRRLLTHACEQARALGYRTLVIQSDPDAEGFYLRCGARRTGESPSASIPGRMLSVLMINLQEKTESPFAS